MAESRNKKTSKIEAGQAVETGHIKELAEKLKAAVEQSMEEAGNAGELVNGKYEEAYAAYEKLSRALDDLKDPTDVEAANGLLENFRVTLPPKLRANIFDLPTIPPSGSEKLNDDERDFEELLVDAKEEVGKITGYIQVIAQTLEVNEKNIPPTDFKKLNDLRKKIWQTRDRLEEELEKKENFSTANSLLDQFIDAYNIFHNTAKPFIEAPDDVKSSTPPDVADDHWAVDDAVDAGEKEKPLDYAQAEKMASRTMTKAEELKKKILENKAMMSADRDSFLNDFNNLTETLKIFLDQTRNNKAYDNDRRVNENLATNFFVKWNPAGTVAKKGVSGGEVKSAVAVDKGKSQELIAAEKMIKRMKDQLEKQIEKIQDKKVVPDGWLETEFGDYIADLDEYLTKVKNKKDKPKDYEYIVDRANNFSVDLNREAEKLEDEPVVSKARTTIGYGDAAGGKKPVVATKIPDDKKAKLIDTDKKLDWKPADDLDLGDDEKEKEKIGPAIWRNKDTDQPVTVIKHLGKGTDGRDYVQIKDKDGDTTGVPLEEIEFLPDAKDPKTEPTEPVEPVEPKKDKAAAEKAEREARAGEFQEKVDIAVGRVSKMEGVLKKIEEAYDKEIPHADLLPDYKKLFKDKKDVIAKFIGALRRFQNFFTSGKDGVKRLPNSAETLKMIQEVESVFNETTTLKDEIEKLKTEAKESFDKKKKELTEYKTDATKLIDSLDDLGGDLIDIERHPLGRYFEPPFISDTEALSKKLKAVRKQANGVEYLTERLLSDLEKSNKYPRKDEETLLSDILPKLKTEQEELDKLVEVWKENLKKQEKKATEEHEDQLELSKSLLTVLNRDQEVLDAFYKYIAEHNPEFVWPDDAERQMALSSAKDEKQINSLIDKKLASEKEFLSAAKIKLDNLGSSDKTSIQDADILASALAEFSKLQLARREQLPILYGRMLEINLHEREAKRDEFERVFAKFHASPAAEKIFSDKLAYLNAWLAELKKSKDAMLTNTGDDLFRAFNSDPEKAKQFSEKYLTLFANFDKTIAQDIADLAEAEQQIKDREDQAKIDSATKNKVKKKKKKETEAPAPEVAPAVPADDRERIMAEQLSLREQRQKEQKSIETILEIAGVVDILPRDIMDTLSEKDFDELKKLAESENRKDFIEFLSQKMGDTVNFFAAGGVERDIIRQRVSENVYDILNQIITDQVESEILKKDNGKTLSNIKMGGKAVLGILASLGVGAGAAAFVTSGGVVAAGAAGAGVVAARRVYKWFSKKEAGKVLEKKADAGATKILKPILRRFWGRKDALNDPDIRKECFEDAADEHLTKEKISVLLSNAMRENTTAAWMENLSDLTKALSGEDTKVISEKNYKDCLEILSGQGLEQFFKNALNYVNVEPRYRALDEKDKINIAMTMALTVGQSERFNLKAAAEFAVVEENAKIKGKTSWLAEKYFKLMAWKDGVALTDSLIKHNTKDGKKWERVAADAWAVLTGGAVVGAFRSTSLTARVLTGAVSGAGAGLSFEQTTRKSESQKVRDEVRGMVEKTEKDLLRYEKIPIDEMKLSELENLSHISTDLQAKIDMGIITDKATKSRIDGVVYRIRKMESEKAMEMEKTLDVLNTLQKTFVKNNNEIDKTVKKILDRLRAKTKNKQPAYMIGGAIAGATLSAILGSYFGGEKGETPEEIKIEDTDSELPAEAPDNLAPVIRERVESYAPAGEGQPYDTDKMVRPTAGVVAHGMPGDISEEDLVKTETPPVTDNPVAEVAPTTEPAEPPAVKTEPALAENPKEPDYSEYQQANDAAVWNKMIEQNTDPKIKADLAWLKTTVDTMDWNDKLQKSLSDTMKEWMDEFKLTGKLVGVEDTLNSFRTIVDQAKADRSL